MQGRLRSAPTGPLASGVAPPISSPAALPDPALALVVEALGRVRFGDIRLTLHEGRLVQVDVTERTRFTQP